MQSTFVHQDHLVRQLNVIFPKADVKTETRKQSQLINPITGAYLELDVWLPSLNIGFEFQDAYHYINTWYSNDTLAKVQKTDAAKKGISQQQGISLIVVPCWWDGTIESLQSTIYFHRPDLFTSSTSSLSSLSLSIVDPISFNPPHQFFPSKELPDVGELMLASFPVSDEFINSILPGEWWMGEKYDGVRFCYNPKQSTLFTRTGNNIDVLPPFIELLPNAFIDAEFWFGRGNFSNTYTLCKGSVEMVNWDLLRMITFDDASHEMNFEPFEKRYHALLDYITIDNPAIVIAPRVTCIGSKHLNFIKEKVIENGGEGVMMRRVGSLYEHGRSLSLMKLKATHSDMEALVLDASDSVTLKLPNGEVIVVPPQQIQTREEIREGTIVTISCDSHIRAKVSNAVILRPRRDLSWVDVIISHLSEHAGATQEMDTNREERTIESMRKFMEDLARQHRLDPLIASSWRSIPFSAISHSKSGRLILRKYGGFFNSLKQLFPDMIGLDKSTFQSLWNIVQNRRAFFEDYARENGFDAYNPNHWYSQRPEQIMSRKGANRVIFYHNFSVSKALTDLFPDIGLDSSKLNTWSWQYSTNRRKFFEMFAAKFQFDPLHTENWYSQNPNDIFKFEGVRNVLWYHNNSVAQALIDLFPNIGLDRSRLLSNYEKERIDKMRLFFESYAEKKGFDPLNAEAWSLQSKKQIKELTICVGRYKNVLEALADAFPTVGIENFAFRDLSNRRLFFENYAKSHDFDPLFPKNWYLQSRELIFAVENTKAVLSYHNNKVSQALIELFPEVEFSRSKLRNIYEWKYRYNRREFFENYARESLFDPLVPSNWYTKLEALKSTKGITNVISHHKYNLALALVDLFPDIGIDISKFAVSYAWRIKENRQMFFEKFAKNNNFDPLVAAHWYLQARERIMASKGALEVILHHKNSVSTALLELFPNIGLEKSMFWRASND